MPLRSRRTRRERVKNRLLGIDERLIFSLAYYFSISFLWTIVAIGLFTVFHEGLHVLGALMEGGQVTEIVWFDASNWFEAYIFPATSQSAELGSVTANIPDGGYFGGVAFYFMPYIVLLPTSLFLMLGDNTRYLIGKAIDNRWRLIGGPLFLATVAAFPTDYSLFLGSEELVFGYPGLLYRIVYLGIIVSGVVGSTFYLYVFNDR